MHRVPRLLVQTTQRRAASTAPAEQAKAVAAGLATRAQAIATPLAHYGKVAFEFGRLVASHGKISLPNPAQIGEAQQGVANFFTAFQNGAWRKVTVSEAGSLVAAGITVYGFFVVGEMIGRGSIVGYNVPGSHAGGHH